MDVSRKREIAISSRLVNPSAFFERRTSSVAVSPFSVKQSLSLVGRMGNQSVLATPLARSSTGQSRHHRPCVTRLSKKAHRLWPRHFALWKTPKRLAYFHQRQAARPPPITGSATRTKLASIRNTPIFFGLETCDVSRNAATIDQQIVDTDGRV